MKKQNKRYVYACGVSYESQIQSPPPPPPFDFRLTLLQHATASQLQAFWGPRSNL